MVVALRITALLHASLTVSDVCRPFCYLLLGQPFDEEAEDVTACAFITAAFTRFRFGCSKSFQHGLSVPRQSLLLFL